MKRRLKQSLAILVLATLGTLAYALHPALLPDTATGADLNAQRILVGSDGQALGGAAQDLDVRYTIDITAPAGQTRYIGDIKPKSFALLQEAKWHIHLTIRNGVLSVETDKLELHATDKLCQVRYSHMVQITTEPGLEKQPDGSYHPIYGVNLLISASVQPSFWGKATNTLAIQTLKIDPVAGTIDPQEPIVSLEDLMGKHTALTVRYPVEGLPSGLGETPKEKALNTILFNLGKIDSNFLATSAAGLLPEAAEKMIAVHTDADKPWPECWGEAAPLAERCAKKIVPTLIYLQENECFKSAGLAKFINSPTFARFFGESFADKAPDPLDAPIAPFPIEQVDNLQEAPADN